MVSTIACFVHIVCFCVHIYKQLYYVWYILPHFPPEGQRLRVSSKLTQWAAMAHTVFFSSCVLADFIEGVLGKKAAGLRKVQDYVLASILFPMSMIVMVVFWGIYAVDRELIFPASLDHVIPPWINHVWHTTIVPVLLLEMYMVHHKYPSRRAGLTGAVTLGLVYLTWILIVAKVGGFWVYPFMAVMTGFQFVLFCCFTAAIGCVFYLTGEICNNVFWGPGETPRKQKKRA